MLKAIETIYNGYRFRSRLEARWAVFFNALGIDYEYEKEGFDLGTPEQIKKSDPNYSYSASGYYLPDFYLPKLDIFIEIKGDKPTQEETDKAILLSQQSDRKVYIFYGSIESQLKTESAENCSYGWDNYHKWCECANCGLFGIEYDGLVERLNCYCSSNGNGGPRTPHLLRAYKLAQQARFEHGETPLVRR